MRSYNGWKNVCFSVWLCRRQRWSHWLTEANGLSKWLPEAINLSQQVRHFKIVFYSSADKLWEHLFPCHICLLTNNVLTYLDVTFGDMGTHDRDNRTSAKGGKYERENYDMHSHYIETICFPLGFLPRWCIVVVCVCCEEVSEASISEVLGWCVGSVFSEMIGVAEWCCYFVCCAGEVRMTVGAAGDVRCVRFVLSGWIGRCRMSWNGMKDIGVVQEMDCNGVESIGSSSNAVAFGWVQWWVGLWLAGTGASLSADTFL